MKSFELAAAEANGADERLPFKMAGDDTQLYAYPPSEGQMVLMLGLADMELSEEDGARGASEVLGVFWELLEESTAAHLRRRLRQRTDAFGLQDIMNIIEWLVQEAGARPTTPSSGSTSSPSSTGTRSTASARQRASTRSSSRQRASAT